MSGLFSSNALRGSVSKVQNYGADQQVIKPYLQTWHLNIEIFFRHGNKILNKLCV